MNYSWSKPNSVYTREPLPHTFVCLFISAALSFSEIFDSEFYSFQVRYSLDFLQIARVGSKNVKFIICCIFINI